MPDDRCHVCGLPPWEFFSAPGLARKWSVCEATVRKLLRSGELRGFRTGKAGQWHIPHSAVDDFVRANANDATTTKKS